MTDGNASISSAENIAEPDLPPLNLPAVSLKLQRDGDILKVYDPLRDRFVALTPEEYVRRHFTEWLMKNKHYPKSLIANELSLTIGGERRRCDTVAFSPEGEPLLIVEYKAPTVQITQTVFDQIARYNMNLRSRYLAVSNGFNHYCCAMDYDSGSYHFIREIPDYRLLIPIK